MIDEPVIPDDPGGDDVADPADEWDQPVLPEDQTPDEVKSGDDASAYEPAS